MFSKLFGLGMIGVLALLALVEVARYARARRAPEDFPYPRRRLARRLAISFLFSLALALVIFWPRASRPLELATAGIILLSLLAGLVLLWRDLRETSLAAVAEAARLDQQAGEAFVETLRRKKEGEAGSEAGPKSKPPDVKEEESAKGKNPPIQ